MSATMIKPRPMEPKPVKKIWGIEDALAANAVKRQMERPRKFNGLRKTRLQQVSPKTRRKLVEYAKVKRIWWSARLEIDGGRCQFVELDGSRCLKQASRSPHHVYGRGRYLCDPSTFCALCLPGHHDWVTANGKEAEARGYLVRDRGLGVL